jgi:integrase
MQTTLDTIDTATKETKRRASTKRRGNGEGSIFQRGDGRWVATLTVGYSAAGKRRRKTVYGWTKKEVQDKLVKLLPQKQDGSLCDSARGTVGQYLDRWLETEVRQNKRASTHASYRQVVELHVKPCIGGLQLSRLSAANVAAMYSTLDREGKSARLVQMAHAVLRRAMHRAVKLGLIGRNPCDGVERPQAPRHEITPLNPQQARALLQATSSHRLHALFILAITSGLRQGELFALRWEDVDLDAGILTVRRTVVQLGEDFIVNEPKTDRGRRRVEIPPIAVDALRDHKARLLKEGFAGDGRVFLSKSGNYLRRNAVRKALLLILKAAGLPEIRFHDLRHTCATLLMLDNTPAKVVQERLGHSNISLTLDIYSHVLPSMQRDAANRLDSLLRDTGT